MTPQELFQEAQPEPTQAASPTIIVIEDEEEPALHQAASQNPEDIEELQDTIADLHFELARLRRLNLSRRWEILIDTYNAQIGQLDDAQLGQLDDARIGQILRLFNHIVKRQVRVDGPQFPRAYRVRSRSGDRTF